MFKFNFYFFMLIILKFCSYSTASDYRNTIAYSPNDTAYDYFITDVFSEGGENYIKML